MKKIFLLSAVILIFCLSQKSSAQNISDSTYRGFNLNYNLVKLVLEQKIFLEDMKKNKIFVTLNDSLKFEVEPCSKTGIVFVCFKNGETFWLDWGKNKINTSFDGPNMVFLKKVDYFYVHYDEGNRFVTPQMKSDAMFFYNKKGTGGFFNEDENGSFIYNSTNTLFSPMDVKNIILFKKRLIDLFLAINAVYNNKI